MKYNFILALLTALSGPANAQDVIKVARTADFDISCTDTSDHWQKARWNTLAVYI